MYGRDGDGMVEMEAENTTSIPTSAMPLTTPHW